jgi:hypothetical protein
MKREHLREYESGNQLVEELQEDQGEDGLRILKMIYR